MPKIKVDGTEFEFSILPCRLFADKFWVRTKISIKNEFVHYEKENEFLTRDEVEKWIFSMFRLLAGAYDKPRSIEFEKAELSFDLVPFAPEGEVITREFLRGNDCIMSVRLVMQTEDEECVGGVYSLLLHREHIREFASGLRVEFDKVFKKYLKGKGKYQFVGVSPFGFEGCNYWYLAERGEVECGDFVWVKMGRRKLEQIVLVDGVRRADEDSAPYPFNEVKRVIRKATQEEVDEWKTKFNG